MGEREEDKKTERGAESDEWEAEGERESFGGWGRDDERDTV